MNTALLEPKAVKTVTTDRFGREFKVGAVVTYPNRRRSLLEVRDGYIVAMKPGYLVIQSLHSAGVGMCGTPIFTSGRLVKVSNTQRVTLTGQTQYDLWID